MKPDYSLPSRAVLPPVGPNRLSRTRVRQIAAGGFALVVGLVLLLIKSRPTDSLRPGRRGAFLARWGRACAACALFLKARTTDSLRSGRRGAFLARWCRACAACGLFLKSRTTDSLRPGRRGAFLARWRRAEAACALATYCGHSSSKRIQDNAQELLRENRVHSPRAAEIESLLIKDTQEWIDRLSLVRELGFLLTIGIAGLTLWVMHRAFARRSWQSAELPRVFWHLIGSHEEPARRLSHERHDKLGASLYGLQPRLSRIGDTEFASTRPDCVRIVADLLQNGRQLLQAKRPVMRDDLGIDPGFRWLVAPFPPRTGVLVPYHSNCVRCLHGSQESHLFRIAQEAWRNVARHAGASAARMSLMAKDGRICLEIPDNGQGESPLAAENGLNVGMVGMRARARQLGGERKIRNCNEGGLRLRIEAPLREVAPHAESKDSCFVG